MSLARRDTAKKLAAKAAKAEQKGLAVGNNEYDLHLALLAQMRVRLKGIKATATKEQVKRDELLPELKPYIDGVLEAATGSQDDVLTTYMVWAFDADQVDDALSIAAYAIEHELTLPPQFDRSLPEWLAEEIADRTIHAVNEGDPVDNAPFTVWAMVKDIDMGDITVAKINKAMGLIIKEKRPESAILHFRLAAKLWKRSGVVKIINAMEKENPALKVKPETEVSSESETADEKSV